MKSFRQLCAALMLACVFTASAYAGEMSAGITGEPPEESETTEANGEMSAGLTEAIVTALQTALAVF